MIVSIGLGVGVNATVFAAANSLLIEPMRVPLVDELVAGLRMGPTHLFTFRGFDELRRETHSFSQVFAETELAGLALAGKRETRAAGLARQHHAFAGMEVVPGPGRFFAIEDDRIPGTDVEMVLAHVFWRERFGADSTVVGRQVRINARAFESSSRPRTVPEHPARMARRCVRSDPRRACAARDGARLLQGSLYVTARLARGGPLPRPRPTWTIRVARAIADSAAYRGFRSPCGRRVVFPKRCASP